MIQGDDIVWSAWRHAAGLRAGRGLANLSEHNDAWLYGAGDAKIGSITEKGIKEGKALKERFTEAVPGLSQLKRVVSYNVDNGGKLPGLDKRILPVRHKHAALNTLLQSAGAVLCMEWLVSAYMTLSEKYRHGYRGDFVFVGWIHDELQVACRSDIAEEVGQVLKACAEKAGLPFGFTVKLDSEYHIGRNWAETH